MTTNEYQMGKADGENLSPNLIADISHQWQVVCNCLSEKLGDKMAIRWLNKIIPGEINEGEVELWVPSPCIGELVERNYADQILNAWKDQDINISKLNFKVRAMEVVRSDITISVKSETVKTPVSVSLSEKEETVSYLNPEYTFDSFVVGKPNEFAYAAARRVADDPAAAFNPLYLHSSVGLGKTHLMQAIAWRMQESMPNKNVLYVSSEQFAHRFIKSLGNKTTSDFRDMFRSVDVLMIDDIQFICGKKATQEEFFHTFNDLVAQGKKVILSSDSAPVDLKGIDDRLKTRLAQGLVVDVHPTTYELRLAILNKKVEKMGVAVSEDVLEFLAKSITTNVRELEGALKRIVAHAELIGAPINMETTKKVLSDVLQACEKTLTVSEIQEGVAAYYHMKLADLKSDRRDRKIARPRQIAMYLSKAMTVLSLPDIALQFGRDHTTVMHAVKTIEKLMKMDVDVAEDVKNITAILREG